MYDTVLFPTNGGVASENAAESAVETAAKHDAELRVLYVVDEPIYSAYSGDEYVHEHEGLESALREVGEEALEEVADEAREAGVEFVTEMRDGTPEQEILEYIAETGPEIVIMGTKERPDEYRQMLGSVTERVLRTTSVPVTVVKTPVAEN